MAANNLNENMNAGVQCEFPVAQDYAVKANAGKMPSQRFARMQKRQQGRIDHERVRATVQKLETWQDGSPGYAGLLRIAREQLAGRKGV